MLLLVHAGMPVFSPSELLFSKKEGRAWQIQSEALPLEVLDCMSLGSCLSLRSLQRLSSSISVLGLARFGSSLSVRRWLESILQDSSLPTRGIPSLFNVLRDFELEVGLKSKQLASISYELAHFL